MKLVLPGILTACVLLTGAVSGAEKNVNLDDRLTSAGKAGWTASNLGPQIERTTIMSCAIDPGSEGTSATVYFSLMGEPGHLSVVDYETGKPIRTLPVEGSQGSYFMRVCSDGNLYLSSHSSGNLYRYRPGSDAVEKLGKPAEHVTFIWDIVEGPAGKLYGSCYPQSTIFEYDMAAGTFRDLGPAKPGEDYGRSITWDDKRQRLYVGIGSHADVIELDPATGDRRSILPEQYRSEQFAYSIGTVDGQVIARMTPSEIALVFDAESSDVITTMPLFTGSTVSDSAPDGSVYFSARSKVIRYDPATRQGGETGYEIRGDIRGFAWSGSGDDRKLLMATTGKRVYAYDTAAHTGRATYCDVPALPLRLHNMIVGPDQRVYTSGYVSGQLGIYDPATGKHEQHGNVKQAEGMTFYDSTLFLGTYPGANLQSFDTTKPAGSDNPAMHFSLKDDGQDRPFGMLGVPEEKKLFMGTVPGYGLLGGALVTIDPDNPTSYEIKKDIFKDHSYVSFAYRDGILYVGTSVSGGLGIEASQESGILFLWDVKKDELIADFVPVEGKQGVTGLRFAKDGKLWGWAEGTLFVFNPETREVEVAEEKFPTDVPPRHFWRGSALSEEIDGKFYGCGYGTVYSLDAKTREVEVIARGGFELIGTDASGNVYSILYENLVQFTPKK